VSNRLSVVRGFARHLQAFDPATEVPPARLVPRSKCRATPYLYSDAEVAALMTAARSLTPALRAATYETLIALLMVTGARVGELIRLDRDDVDWDDSVLVIWDSKFAKSRELALHPSTVDALRRYAALRDRSGRSSTTASFFVSAAGTRLVYRTVQQTFSTLLRRAGLTPRSDRCRPRIHDARHSFAVRTVLGWYRDGVDVQARLPWLSTYLGHRKPACTYWYFSAVPELVFLSSPRAARPRGRATRTQPGGPAMSILAPTLEAYFTERLIGQRHASPNTIAAYRDAWRLLLRFVSARTGKQPCQLDLADLDAPLIGAFLDHLEADRHNSPRTRNARLAALRSFFFFAALRHPEHGALIARVLAIPTKRCDRAEVTYLVQAEADAVLAAPDRRTWTGRRDHALLDVALQTGLRASELTGLRNQDVELGTGAHVQCWGKGRKQRCTPLSKQTVAVLQAWMRERQGQPNDPLFPTRRGTPLTRAAMTCLVSKHATTAQRRCPSLRTKRATPHVLRHSCAMQLLQSGTDTTVIALWLGHERAETTARIYLHADMSIKERALARTTPVNTKPGRYRPIDQLLAFLDNL
jgi:integrase/recombinase XerD